MKDTSLVRYGAATAIGIAMACAVYQAGKFMGGAENAVRGAEMTAEVSIEATRSVQRIDAALAAAAQSIATAPVDQARFGAVASRFFEATGKTQGLVFFRRASDDQAALQMGAPLAEGVTQFRASNGTLYLAATHAARDPRRQGELTVFSGGQGRIPYELSAGQPVQQAMAQALAAAEPVASSLYATGTLDPRPVQALVPGEGAGFWRFLRVTGPVGEPVGMVGTFVDAGSVFAGVAEVTGPAAASGPGVVSAGGQSFVVRPEALPARDGGASLSSIAVALLAGLAAALAALYASTRESIARRAAEQQLALQKRSFQRRTVELKRSEDRFKRLAESTNVIPWAADLSERRFTYIGPQIERISGYPARSWCAKGFWVDHVHPGDRQRVFSESLENLKPGDYATVEYRIRSADGRVVHIRNMLTLIAAKAADGSETTVAQGYMLDITEMTTARIALEDARHAAEQANKSKSEFLANMSHELRTPLNAVIGFAEVMKDEVFGPMGDRYQEYAENVHTSGKHLLSLINDVLDLSKIEAGKIELVEEETDVSAMLSKCRQLLHERASQAGLHIRLDIPAPVPSVMVDSRRIKQVILNLMSNAVKFTAPGGRITLSAKMDAPRGLRIGVVDTGIGMTKEEIEVALEQFGQIDSELSRQHEGTGLGLPIARSLAELHGGGLEIESKPEVGTTVTLLIPTKRIVSTTEKLAKAG